MTTEDGELLSALLDGEPVEPAALARVLEDPEGRRTLVAFATLRARAQSPAPGEAVWAGRQTPLARAPAGTWRLAAAAAVLVAAVAAGMFVVQRAGPEGPPEPSRVVQLDPGTANGGVR
jgi:hypothetical protein